MAQSVKLSDDVMARVRREAETQSRSVAGQITHWIRIGRAIERSAAYDHSRIADALEGRVDTAQLSEEEEAVWLDAFTEKMGQPAEAEQAFYARRQRLGQGVGLGPDGALVYAREGAQDACGDDTAAP